MHRRTFLKATTGTPLLAARATGTENEEVVGDVSKRYFDALPETKEERNEAVVGCASELCSETDFVSQDTLDAVVFGGESAQELVRFVHFGVKILNEYNLTDVVDESTVESGRWKLSQATRYIPLIGSFNRLRGAACAVEQPDPNPRAVTDFLYASMAFGIEVALWSIGAPYKMAWNGTRFIANRTFLRYAQHGCSGCVAFAMSQLHWAIRGSVYGHGVTERRVEFVWERIQELKAYARELEYDVKLDYSRGEIEDMISQEAGGAVAIVPRENKGLLDRYLPDIDIDLDFKIGVPEVPTLSDLFD